MTRLLLLGLLSLAISLPVVAQEKKTDEKKQDQKKTDEKKSDEKKSDEKKTNEKKTDEKKTDEKKTDEKKPAADGKPQLTVEVTNLFNPCGVAIQGRTGDVFISDSGHLRILRYALKPTRKISEEIVAFTKDVYGKGEYENQTKFDIGPLGLLFLNDNLLAVGGGGHPDGQELMYFFDVGQGNQQQADNAKYKIGPIAPGAKDKDGNEGSPKGEGNFYAMAYVKPSSLYITANGEDTKGWVARVKFLTENVPEKQIELAIPTKEYTQDVDAPVGIALGPDKKLVIGQMGEVSGKGKDSLLLSYDPEGGKPQWKAETGLYDIAALAYHPKSKKLYALDYAWEAPKEGGLFRLDVSGEGESVKVKAERVTYGYKPTDIDPKLPFTGDASALDKPTAMAFDDDGNLYITCIGTPKSGESKKPGRLVRIVGLE
jgi:hypothetical protein